MCLSISEVWALPFSNRTKHCIRPHFENDRCHRNKNMCLEKKKNPSTNPLLLPPKENRNHRTWKALLQHDPFGKNLYNFHDSHNPYFPIQYMPGSLMLSINHFHRSLIPYASFLNYHTFIIHFLNAFHYLDDIMLICVSSSYSFLSDFGKWMMLSELLQWAHYLWI